MGRGAFILAASRMESRIELPGEFFGIIRLLGRGCSSGVSNFGGCFGASVFGAAVAGGGVALGCGIGALGNSFTMRSGSFGAGGAGCGVGGATLRSTRGSTIIAGGGGRRRGVG